eukprot:scaffold9982_cov22-Tisochrysis_lutea.AAC.1
MRAQVCCGVRRVALIGVMQSRSDAPIGVLQSQERCMHRYAAELEGVRAQRCLQCMTKRKAQCITQAGCSRAKTFCATGPALLAFESSVHLHEGNRGICRPFIEALGQKAHAHRLTCAQAATAQLKATGSLSQQMEATLAAERAKHAAEMEGRYGCLRRQVPRRWAQSLTCIIYSQQVDHLGIFPSHLPLSYTHHPAGLEVNSGPEPVCTCHGPITRAKRLLLPSLPPADQE